MGGSSGQQPVTQQTTQTRDPWFQAAPHLVATMGQAANFYNAGVGYQPYGGQMQAPLTNDLANALQTMRANAIAEAPGTAGVNAARSTGTQLIGDYGLSPQLAALYNEQSTQENPYLQAILDTNNRRIGDRINASMSGAGRYGSGQHTDVMARALAEAADPILAQDYTRRQQARQGILEGGLQRQGNWAQIMPGLDQARYAGLDRLFGIGEYQQTRDQADINNAIKIWNAQQALPWEQLARYNAIASGVGGLGGQQVTAAPGATQPGTLQRIIGGSIAGAGLGSAIPGIGTGIGAIGGGLLGLL